MEAYFPSESTLPLSGEINANKGGEEDWRSEGMTTKDWKKCNTNKGLNLIKEWGEKRGSRSRGENGMGMPIKVGNWSPLQLSIPHVHTFPWWWCEIRQASELSRWDRQELKCHMFRTAPRRKSNAPVISLNTREAPNIRLSPLCCLVYFQPLCVTLLRPFVLC